MPRYSRKDIESLTEAMCREFGLKYSEGGFIGDPDTIYLDHNPTYGGYAVCKKAGPPGTHSSLRVTDKRYSPNELAEHISFALAMLRQAGKSEPYEAAQQRIKDFWEKMNP